MRGATIAIVYDYNRLFSQENDGGVKNGGLGDFPQKSKKEIDFPPPFKEGGRGWLFGKQKD